MPDKPVYRVSYLSAFEYCGWAYYLRYIENKRSLGTFYSARGTGCHKARELNLKQKIESGKDLSLKPMQDAARDSINRQIKDGELDLKTELLAGLGKKAAAGKIIDSTVRLVDIDRTNLQSKIQPLEVEQEITIHLPKWPFDISMRLDAITVNLVIDLKTAKQKWSDLKAAKSYQPKVYKLGYRAHRKIVPFEGFRYDIVVCTPKQQRLSAYSIMVDPPEAQIHSVLERFNAMHNSIQAGLFLPCHRGHWKCSPEYCSFYRVCKYV